MFRIVTMCVFVAASMLPWQNFHVQIWQTASGCCASRATAFEVNELHGRLSPGNIREKCPDSAHSVCTLWRNQPSNSLLGNLQCSCPVKNDLMYVYFKWWILTSSCQNIVTLSSHTDLIKAPWISCNNTLNLGWMNASFFSIFVSFFASQYILCLCSV